MIRECIVLVLALVACGGGDDGTTGGDSGTSDADDYITRNIVFSDLPDNRALVRQPSLNHPMVLTAGARTFALGEALTAPHDILTWFDGLEPTGAVGFANTDTAHDAFIPTALTSDGANGVYLLGMNADVNERFHPAIVHFDSTGALVWSKQYTDSAPLWSINAPTGTTSGVASSDVVAGKLAVVGGSGVMVIDTAGALQWVSIFTPMMQLHQALADASGFTVYGIYYADFYTFRFDWSGTLISQQTSAMALPVNASAAAFFPPFRASDGRVHVPYSVNKVPTTGLDGVMVFDASGALVDNYQYVLTAEEDPNGIRSTIYKNGRTRVLSDTLVETVHIWLDTANPPPYVVHRAHFVFAQQTGAVDPTKLTQAEATFVPVGSKVMALGGSGGTYVAPVGAPCTYPFIEVTSLVRQPGGLTLTPFAAPISPMTLMPMTVTVSEMPITATSAGTLTVTKATDTRCKP